MTKIIYFFFKYLYKTIKNKRVHFDKNIKLGKEFINIYKKLIVNN